MDRKHLLQLLLLSSLLITAGSGFAGIYRWVDTDGRVHFGERPPAQADQSDEVVIRNQEPSSAPANVDRKKSRDRLLEQYQRERYEKKQQAEKRRQEKKKLEKMCDDARERLSTYTRGGALYERLPNQKRRYLSEAERNAAIAATRKEIKKLCK